MAGKTEPRASSQLNRKRMEQGYGRTVLNTLWTLSHNFDKTLEN